MIKPIRLLTTLLAIVAGLVLAIGFFYWRYATNTDSPYDEVGVMLNQYMPGPILDWGCGRLHQTFGNVLPPYGCTASDGNSTWR